MLMMICSSPSCVSVTVIYYLMAKQAAADDGGLDLKELLPGLSDAVTALAQAASSVPEPSDIYVSLISICCGRVLKQAINSSSSQPAWHFYQQVQQVHLRDSQQAACNRAFESSPVLFAVMHQGHSEGLTIGDA